MWIGGDDKMLRVGKELGGGNLASFPMGYPTVFHAQFSPLLSLKNPLDGPSRQVIHRLIIRTELYV